MSFSGPISERRIRDLFFLHPTRTEMPGTLLAEHGQSQGFT
jgi:hypothetical protein